jgi:Group II intron, maturase-specific domain
MGKLKLTVNEDKTRICTVPEGEFDFLGFTFGQMFSRTTGQARLALRPSKKSIKRVVEKLHELTVRARTWQDTTELVGMLNRTLRGWANYFSVGTITPGVSGARQLRGCAVAPVVALQAQNQTKPGRQLSTPAPLRDLRARASDPAWARRAVGKGVRSCPRAGCREIRMSGSMRGMWKRSYGRAAKAQPDERGGNRHARPTATAPHPDSTR